MNSFHRTKLVNILIIKVVITTTYMVDIASIKILTINEVKIAIEKINISMKFAVKNFRRN